MLEIYIVLICHLYLSKAEKIKSVLLYIRNNYKKERKDRKLFKFRKNKLSPSYKLIKYVNLSNILKCIFGHRF